MTTNLIKVKNYLLLIDEEAEIKEGKTFITKENIIHTVFGYNYGDRVVIAYYPLTKEAKELDLPLLPPFEREIDINEIAKQRAIDRKWHPNSMETRRVGNEIIEAVKYGYEIAQSKQFSLDDMKKAIEMAREYEFIRFGDGDTESKYTEEEIIQSLSTQRMPSKFIPELVIISNDEVYFDKQLKTITNSEGKEEIIGKYVY